MEREIVIELEEDKIDIEIGEEQNEGIEIKDVERVPTGSVSDYEKLSNKPKIEGIELIGDRSFKDLGMVSITNLELEKLLK